MSNQLTTKTSRLESLIFAFRPVILILFLLLTVGLASQAVQVKPEASFEKLIPLSHPYIENFIKRKDDLSGLGNAIRISVAVNNPNEDIFTAAYMQRLKEVYEQVRYLKGVDQAGVRSLWDPAIRWTQVTAEGFEGGTIIPDDYTGDAASLNKLRQNLLKSSQLGVSVANDFRSTLITVPLLEKVDGQPLNYQEFSNQLEELRAEFSDADFNLGIVGFAKLVGDLINGASLVAMFFLLALVTTFLLLLAYSRCIKSTLVALACSVIAVIWQLGLLNLLGYGLDPYSMLVPFLVFAIAVSHGVQVINAIAYEASYGVTRLEAAKLAFRSLYIAGVLALISDALGFTTLFFIKIQVIQELALAASLGVGVIILTNLVLLPLLISYLGVGAKATLRAKNHRLAPVKLWQALSNLANPKFVPFSLGIAGVLALVGVFASSDLQIGDLDKGAPELRPNSVYNLDSNFITDNYSTSADVLVVMVETPPEGCVAYEALAAIDRLDWQMQNTPGVQGVVSPAGIAKLVITGFNEGNLKWQALSNDQFVLNQAMGQLPAGMINNQCDLLPVILYLEDHKANTLAEVTAAVEDFAAKNNSEAARFLLAAGTAGIEAATNAEIAKAENLMLVFVYSVVGSLVLLTFRSLKALVSILTPLALTSILCQALMAQLGIGVKVATLPVIALGVGIGVDYGIYIYARLESLLKQGYALQEAYYLTLKSTGKAVTFTGLTLALAVGTWVFSPIKFQADMGILLTFMFLWNMLGAICLLPAFMYLFTKKKADNPA